MKLNKKMLLSAICLSALVSFSPAAMADHHKSEKGKICKDGGKYKEEYKKMKKMSPEERAAYIQTLPAEKQAKIKERMARKAEHKALKEKMKGMSKEERKAYIETLPAEQQEKIKKHRKKMKDKKGGKYKYKNKDKSNYEIKGRENGLNFND